MERGMGRARDAGEADPRTMERDALEREVARLRAVEARARAAADALPDGLAIFDAQDRLVFHNARYPEHLLSPLREGLAIGKRFDDWLREGLARGPIYHPDMGPDFIERRLAMRAAGVMEHEHRIADGRWLRIRESPTPDGGRILLTTDVTEAHRHAEEIRILASAVEQVGDPVEITGADNALVYVNRAFEAVTGWRRDEALGRAPQDVLSSGAHPPEFFEAMRARLEGGESWHGAIVNRRRDGLLLEQETTISPIRDEAGRIAHFVAVKRDVTEARAQARALAESEARYRAVVETQTEMVMRFDPAGLCTFMNDACVRAIGMTREELNASGARDPVWVIDEDLHLYDEHMARITPETPTDPVEWRVRHPDGSIHWEQWTDTGVFDAEGRLMEIQCVGREITAQKEAEARLRASEARLATIIAANPVAMNIARISDRRVLFVNEPYLRMYGLEGVDLETFDRDTLYPDPAERDMIYREIAAGREVAGVDLMLRRADGVAVPASLSSRPIELDGEAALVTTTIDLTALRAAEAEIARQREALHQSEKMTALGSLLAGVAHELNNPLSVVVGYSSMLRELIAEPEMRARVERIHAAAERCARIVRGFLAMARARPPDRGPVPIAEVVAGALELAAYGLRSADVAVELDIPADLPSVWGDADQLHQVVVNLVVNAQHALVGRDPPRRITVRARAEAGTMTLEIADNGPGMSPEVASRAFDPFFTTKPQGVGTGVGLSVCHGVVLAHGGSIAVETAPGAGACFRMTLPTGAAAPAAEASAAAPVALAGRVLVVDDEPDIAALLADHLRGLGLDVVTAPSGRRALAALGAGRFDAVVTDLRMADVDGAALVAAIGAERPELADRLILITGDALGAGLGPAAAAPGLARLPVFEKPLDLAALTAELRRVIAGAAP